MIVTIAAMRTKTIAAMRIVAAVGFTGNWGSPKKNRIHDNFSKRVESTLYSAWFFHWGEGKKLQNDVQI